MELYLRFTSDPYRDLSKNYSFQTFWKDEEKDILEILGKEVTHMDDGSYSIIKAGLSGHKLSSESLTAAIAEVNQGSWYGEPDCYSWAIFEGYMNGIAQDTVGGVTFKATNLAYFKKTTSEIDYSK